MKNLKTLLFIVASIFILIGCSAQNADLNCTRVFDENDSHVYKYSFEDGKAYLFDLTLTAPADGIANIDTYENEFMKINDVTGCKGVVTRNEDGSYTSQQVCNFNEMSDDDIQAVYMDTREALQNTRKEIIEHFEYDEGMKCE